jgi:hypothetical protein
LHNGGTWGLRSFAVFAPQSGTATIVLGLISHRVAAPILQRVL